jgi:small subunit ribosomal protein S9
MASTAAAVSKPLLLLARGGNRANNPWAKRAALSLSSPSAGDLFLCTTPPSSKNNTSRHFQIRSFSDDNSNNNQGVGGIPRRTSFPIRRPQQGGGGFRQQQQQGGGFYDRGDHDEDDDDFVYTPTSRPPPPPQRKHSILRTHMIDLFPGNYEDDDEGDGGLGMESDDEDIDEYEDMSREMYEYQEAYEKKKQKWIENSKPVVRYPVIDPKARSYGRGGRKTAQARVWITPGFGNVTVNRKDFIDYFPRRSDREKILDPMVVTETCGKFDLQCIVKGGGLTGQAGAIRLGVARALQHWNPEWRPPMKKMGYLTRDARKVERKKIGRVKARKRPQWNRR